MEELEKKKIIKKILLFLGYKCDYPDSDDSWWYKENPNIELAGTLNNYISNNISLMVLLFSAVLKIKLKSRISLNFTIDSIECSLPFYNISEHGNKINDVLLISINKYLDKK